MEATVENINDELDKYKNLHRIVEVDGFYDKSHDLKVSMLSKTIKSPHTLPRSLGINKSLINDKRKVYKISRVLSLFLSSYFLFMIVDSNN